MTSAGSSGAMRALIGVGRLQQAEPVEAVAAQRQEVGQLADARKFGQAEHLDRHHPLEARTGRARPAAPSARGWRRRGSGRPRAGGRRRAPCGSAAGRNSIVPRPKTWNCLRSADHPLHPVEQRGRRALLRLDVDRLVAVDRVHDRRREEPRRIGAREAGVAVAGPLHRRADAVAVAEIDVVAHADLVAVVDDRRAGHRHQQAVQQLDARPAVLHQRREPAADADVDPHLRIGGVRLVHVVALLVGDHLERQLVVVAEEHRPLAVRRGCRASAAGSRRSGGGPPAGAP